MLSDYIDKAIQLLAKKHRKSVLCGIFKIIGYEKVCYF